MTNMKKKVKNVGIGLMVGALALQNMSPLVGEANYQSGESIQIESISNTPIRISAMERAGVNTTIFGWSVGIHPGHERSAVIASGEGYRVSVYAHEDRPWEVVSVGELPQDVIFWIYIQGASRNSVGGNTSSWTSRDVYRMQVIVSGEGTAVIPMPESILNNQHGYQLKLGNPNFATRPEPEFDEESDDTFFDVDVDGLTPEIDIIEEEEDPVATPVPLPDDVDLGDWILEVEDDETFYDVEADGMMPEFEMVEPEEEAVILPIPLPDDIDLDENVDSNNDDDVDLSEDENVDLDDAELLEEEESTVIGIEPIQQTLLPQTGAQVVATTLLGGMLLGIAAALMKIRKLVAN